MPFCVAHPPHDSPLSLWRQLLWPAATLMALLSTFSYSVLASDGVVSNNWQCGNIGQQLLFERASVEQIYIAVSLCEGLVHPMDSGIGGGFQALLYDNHSSHYLMSREYSPWNKEFLKRPFVFGNSIGVPSVLAGYGKLLGVDRCVSVNNRTRRSCRFAPDCSLATYDINDDCVRDILGGKSASGLRPQEQGVPYPRIFEAVIELAQKGFEVSRTLRVVMEKSDQLPYFLRPAADQNKITNLALGNFLSFLAYNPIRLLDPYYAWTKRRVRDDLNTTLIMLNDVRSYNSQLTDFDFFTYRASWRRSFSFSFKFANQSYRFSTMPKPAGGETIAFFFRMMLTLLESPSYRRFNDMQYSTLFVLFSKYTFAVKLYFRQVSRKTSDRLINDEAPYIARKLIADIKIRTDEKSLVDYMVNETPGIPHVFGRLSLPRVVVFQVRSRKRAAAAFTSETNRTTSTTSDRPTSGDSFRLFYTRDRNAVNEYDDDDDDDDDEDGEDNGDGDAFYEENNERNRGNEDVGGSVGVVHRTTNATPIDNRTLDSGRKRPTSANLPGLDNARHVENRTNVVETKNDNDSTSSASYARLVCDYANPSTKNCTSSTLFSDVLSTIRDQMSQRNNGDSTCDRDDEEETYDENLQLTELTGKSVRSCLSRTLLQDDDLVTVLTPQVPPARNYDETDSLSATSIDSNSESANNRTLTSTLKLLIERKFKVADFNDQLATGVDVDQMNHNLRQITMPNEHRYQNNEYDDDGDVIAGLQLLLRSNSTDDGFAENPYGTTNVVVKRGNRCIVATSSINHSFGSLIFSQNLGIPYNNVLRDFTPHNWFLKRSTKRRPGGGSSSSSSSSSFESKQSLAGSSSNKKFPENDKKSTNAPRRRSINTPLQPLSRKRGGAHGGGGGGGHRRGKSSGGSSVGDHSAPSAPSSSSSASSSSSTSSSSHSSSQQSGAVNNGATAGAQKTSLPNSVSPSGFGNNTTNDNNGPIENERANRRRRRRSTSHKSNVISFTNHPRPHSIPQSSMACTIIWNTETGNPVFAIGAAGGFKITSAILNIFWNYFILNDSMEKSFARLRLTTKLNYKTRKTELWYEFPIESPFYNRLLSEKSLIYNQLRYQDFTFLSSASRVVDYPRLAYAPRFFFDHRQELNVKYIFEAGYSAATGCSTMRNSRLHCNFDRRRGGKFYVHL